MGSEMESQAELIICQEPEWTLQLWSPTSSLLRAWTCWGPPSGSLPSRTPESLKHLPSPSCVAVGNICLSVSSPFPLTWSIHLRFCYVVIYLQFSYFLGTSCRKAPKTKQILTDLKLLHAQLRISTTARTRTLPSLQDQLKLTQKS